MFRIEIISDGGTIPKGSVVAETVRDVDLAQQCRCRAGEDHGDSRATSRIRNSVPVLL